MTTYLYNITVNAKNTDEVIDMIAWVDKFNSGSNYNYSINFPGCDWIFHFMDQELATMFALKWS